MRYEEVTSFEQLAEAIQKHIESGKFSQAGSLGTFEGEYRTLGGRTDFDMTAARLAFVRLKKEGSRSDLPGEIPTDAIDLLNVCMEAARPKLHKPEADRADLSSEPTSKAQQPKITEAHKKAHRSYEWVCEDRPGLIPQPPTRYTRDLYNHMKENCPEYSSEEPAPDYETWKRYLRHYEHVLNDLKNTPRAGRVQPQSGIAPDDIQSLNEITNQFKKD
jgi:hypothetical protein